VDNPWLKHSRDYRRASRALLRTRQEAVGKQAQYPPDRKEHEECDDAPDDCLPAFGAAFCLARVVDVVHAPPQKQDERKTGQERDKCVDKVEEHPYQR